MHPELANRLLEQVPSIGPWMIGVIIVGIVVSLAQLWPLLRYGPRFWRVERKLRQRALKKETNE